MNVYADNAATTKMCKAASREMLLTMERTFGNPSSLHSEGQDAAMALRSARERIAARLGCQADEIVFTSGGIESDNQALFSAARLGAESGKRHIVTTAFEHHAILHTLEALKAEGFEVTLLDVHGEGIVTPEEVRAALRPDTCLVCIWDKTVESFSIPYLPEFSSAFYFRIWDIISTVQSLSVLLCGSIFFSPENSCCHRIGQEKNRK